MCLPHQVVGNALLSVVGMGANAADVGRLHLLPVIQQVVRQGLKSRHHAIVYLANDVVFGSEHAREVQVHELLRVAKHQFPQLACLFFDAVHVLEQCQWVFLHHAVLLQKDVGLVRFFCPSQSFVAHILFAIDVEILFGQVFHKLLVDDGEGPFVVYVGLLNAHIEGVLVDGTAKGEGHQLIVYPNGAARKPQSVPSVEGAGHRTQFNRELFV